MSPDRVTITRAEALRRRREEEKKKLEQRVEKRVVTPKPAPAKKKVDHTPRATTPVITSRFQRRYDIAYSSPQGRSAKPKSGKGHAISLPRISFGPRWISFPLAVACIALLYLMYTSQTFIVQSASVTGNQRVPTAQIESILGVFNQPSAILNPAQIEYNILATFPDIASADVEIAFPADVSVSVVERQPVAAWQQDGQTVWVDAQGFAFPPRGTVASLTTITASGAPPAPSNVDVTQMIGARPFLTSALAKEISTLTANIPQGAALVYDPQYGLGWKDPRGWNVYFGDSDGDITMKLQVYQTLVSTLTQRGIQPVLISVEYPNAPFYRVGQQQ